MANDEPGFITSPECGDYRVAAEHALVTGDTEQAATMIAAALAKDPLDHTSLALLDRITSTRRDP